MEVDPLAAGYAQLRGARMDKAPNRWIIRFIHLAVDSPTAMRPLRIALIWMLMLALPAQSMAAIGMQLCALNQQNGALAQQMAAHHPAAVAPVEQDAAFDHGQHHAGASSSVQQVDNSLCSLCAFCVGAVALSSVLVGNPQLQSLEPSLARLDQFVGFIAETPERPPRLFLA